MNLTWNTVFLGESEEVMNILCWIRIHVLNLIVTLLKENLWEIDVWGVWWWGMHGFPNDAPWLVGNWSQFKCECHSTSFGIMLFKNPFQLISSRSRAPSPCLCVQLLGFDCTILRNYIWPLLLSGFLFSLSLLPALPVGWGAVPNQCFQLNGCSWHTR